MQKKLFQNIITLKDPQRSKNLLIEIGTEELPPMSLASLELEFKKNLMEQLTVRNLSFTVIKSMATPRRIAVIVEQLITEQPDLVQIKKGPSVKIAFDHQGNPTLALIGFLKSLQITLEQTTQIDGHIQYSKTEAGVATSELIPEILQQVIDNLHFQKMYWGNLEQGFIRPVHWIIVLFGKQIVNVNLFNIKSNNITYGHRFLAPQAITINDALEYENKLETVGKVIVDSSKRKQLIVKELNLTAQKLQATCVLDQNLLEQVTAMTEAPQVLFAEFAEEFLRLPKECLISAMKHHQKSFYLINKEDQLMAGFMLISNMPIRDPSNIINGNKRVMHARLQDAAFLYNQDLKTPLLHMVEKLKTVVLQEKLGSIYEQTIRIQTIAVKISELLNLQEQQLETVKQASFFCKADLVSKMVLEFPELQGIMGYYYVINSATHTDKNTINFMAIANSIKEHYLPKFAADDLPESKEGICLAVAYRLDLLCGLFAIGKIPTGEKDPFALRRHALAIIRILIDKKISIDLLYLIKFSLTIYQEHNKTIPIKADLSNRLLDFFWERLKNWYSSQNVAINFFNAVLDPLRTNFYDFNLRINAIIKFSELPDAKSLISANKRVNNLLEKIDQHSLSTQAIDPSLFNVTEESLLFEQLLKLETIITADLLQQSYELTLQHLATLKPFIDQFFDKVMVMVDDLKIRQNRLVLLFILRKLFLKIADFSYLSHIG